MRKGIVLLLAVLCTASWLPAQSPADSIRPVSDSLVQLQPVQDSVPADSPDQVLPVVKKPLLDTGWTLSPGLSATTGALQWQILLHHPYFNFKPVLQPVKKANTTYNPGRVRQPRSKDLLFYALLFLFALFALLKQGFPKYFTDLFRLFFRTTLKERQISEQLMQSPVPSVLLNVFFTLSVAFYISFMVEFAGKNPVDEFWLLYVYCVAGLSAAYLIKFIGLKISGWIFAMQGAAQSYVFVVFIINKMLGILLLPFLPVLAFSTGEVFTVALTLSWCLLGGLLLYRLFLTYAVIRNQVRVSPFHFFLYFIAFEIAPLLLVYKALLVFFS